MHAIFQSLPGLIDELTDGTALEAVASAIWPNVLGEHLRERSSVIGLNEGILLVAVSDLEWKREFEEHAGQIRFKLNRALGSAIVRRIDFTVDRRSVDDAHREKVQPAAPQTGKPLPKDIEASSAKIADGELRTNFLQAAAACIDRRDAK
jgi:hypothetical protein